MKLSNAPLCQPRFLLFVSSRRQRRWRRLLYDPNSITIFLFSFSYPSNFFLYWLRLFRFFASPHFPSLEPSSWDEFRLVPKIPPTYNLPWVSGRFKNNANPTFYTLERRAAIQFKNKTIRVGTTTTRHCRRVPNANRMELCLISSSGKRT